MPAVYECCHDRLRALRAIVEDTPADGTVTVPVTWLQDLLDAESDSSDMRLLTLQEIAEFVGRSVSTVRTWVNTGQLDGFKLNGRSWRIRERAFKEFIERQQSGEPEPPAIRSSASVDLGAWRKHIKTENGAA